MQMIDNVWKEYKTTGDLSLRNQLVEHYLPLLKKHAEKINKNTPGNIDFFDLKQDGVIGLIEAVEAFDPSRGIKFETFSKLRIKGSMYDKVRDQDWIPRLVRNRYKRISKVVETLNLRLGRKPTYTEIAHQLDIPAETFKQWLKSLPVEMNVFSSYEQQSYKQNPIYELTANDNHNPARIVEDRDFREYACKGEDRTNKLMIDLFLQEQTCADVARAAGMSAVAITYRKRELYERLTEKGVEWH
jgi:RNA polymerase sigma factor for flagellar operon FliA